MSEPRFDIFFRGDIVPGRRLDEVRDRLRQLFQIEDARLNALFSGRPTVIRRDLSAADAERYRAALHDAGAQVELRPLHSPDAPVTPSSQAAPEASWTLAPVGADVLRPEERSQTTAPSIDLGGLEVAPVGADVLRPDQRHTAVARDIDTAHLGLVPSAD